MLNIPENEIVWVGKPSHLTKIGTYILCFCIFLGSVMVLSNLPDLLYYYPEFYWIFEILCLGGAIGSLIFGGWTIINVIYTKWILTSETLYSKTNFLMGEYDTTWVHLIRDVGARKPLLWRIFGLGWVKLVTLDRTHPNLFIGLIPDSEELKILLNAMARKSAKKHGTRVVDMGG